MLVRFARPSNPYDIQRNMKILLPISLAAGALAILPALVPASNHGARETLGGGMRKLRKLVKDPKSKELLPLLEEMEAAAMIALANPPEAPGDLKDADLALWKISFRMETLVLAQEILSMQTAAVNQDGEALKAASKALVERKKSGHDKFQ